jgi:hypothetical protein
VEGAKKYIVPLDSGTERVTQLYYNVNMRTLKDMGVETGSFMLGKPIFIKTLINRDRNRSA